MMRLTAPGFERFAQADSFQCVYGGAEANVAVSLSQMGQSSTHITVFPEHALGKAASAYLQRTGVDTQYIQFGEGRLGLYFLENGAMQRSSKIIYDRFDSAFSKMMPGSFDWDAIMKTAAWFHWTGITPAISANAAKVCLEALQAAKKQGVMVSGDINYRRNLWQYGKSAQDVMPELIAHSHIVVGGEVDFENCLGIIGDNFKDTCDKVARQYNQIEKITTTERESLSASHNKLSGVLWSNEQVIRSATYDMASIVDRIGGGDAFMAGLVYGLLNLNSDEEALNYAVAASVLKHSIPGDANLASAAEILQLMNGENVGKLLR